MTLSELGCLRLVWPKTLFVFMSRYQHDLERMRKECRECFGYTQLGNCTHCGKHIQQNLGKHIALYHIELAQLWRCPVTWCTVWKETAQDCVDHMRRTHDAPLAVKAANLAHYFPPWTATREQWLAMIHPSISGVAIDTLLFSRSELMRLSGGLTCDGYMHFWRSRIQQVGTPRTEHRMFILDPQSVVGLSPGPGDLVSRRGGGGGILPSGRNRFVCLRRRRPLYKL